MIPHRQEDLDKNGAFICSGFWSGHCPTSCSCSRSPCFSVLQPPAGFLSKFFMLFMHPSSLAPSLLQSPVEISLSASLWHVGFFNDTFSCAAL